MYRFRFFFKKPKIHLNPNEFRIHSHSFFKQNLLNPVNQDLEGREPAHKIIHILLVFTTIILILQKKTEFSKFLSKHKSYQISKSYFYSLYTLKNKEKLSVTQCYTSVVETSSLISCKQNLFCFDFVNSYAPEDTQFFVNFSRPSLKTEGHSISCMTEFIQKVIVYRI